MTTCASCGLPIEPLEPAYNLRGSHPWPRCIQLLHLEIEKLKQDQTSRWAHGNQPANGPFTLRLDGGTFDWRMFSTTKLGEMNRRTT